MKTADGFEIGLLFRTRSAVLSFIEEATVWLEQSFPDTLQEMQTLLATFDQEFEENLLRAYEGLQQ